MAPSDFDLIPISVEFTLDHALKVQEEVVEALQHSGSTSLVTALRMLTTQCAIVAIGAVSFFESHLQQVSGWKAAFPELDRHLRDHGHVALADRFNDFKLAINVLKHGDGPSYDRLLARIDELPFVVKGRGEPFFEEGDVSEVGSLVEANPEFVRKCSSVIEEIVLALREDGVGDGLI